MYFWYIQKKMFRTKNIENTKIDASRIHALGSDYDEDLESDLLQPRAKS